MNEQTSNGSATPEVDAAIGLANQLAHLIVLSLKTVHTYVAPRAESFGVRLSAKEKHAWAMNLAIALSQNKAYLKMPATRLEKPTPKRTPSAATPKAAPLFADRKGENEALTQLRQLMEKASVTEAELLAIMREAGTKEAMFASDLSTIPDRVLQLAIQRWDTIVELAKAGRAS